jgi:hypothetical protein
MVTALAAAVRVLGWATATPLAAARAGTADFDTLVGLAAALTCWLLIGWVGLVFAVTALALIPGAVGRLGRHGAARLTPAAARQVARLALGLAVVAAPVVGASSAIAVPAATSSGARSEPAFLPGVGRPGWSADVSTSAQPSPAAGEPASQRATAVVEPGDCLWNIAVAQLGPDASDAEIAAEWPRWYAVNRRVIGSDPNLITPGTVLRAPAAR